MMNIARCQPFRTMTAGMMLMTTTMMMMMMMVLAMVLSVQGVGSQQQDRQHIMEHPGNGPRQLPHFQARPNNRQDQGHVEVREEVSDLARQQARARSSRQRNNAPLPQRQPQEGEKDLSNDNRNVLDALRADPSIRAGDKKQPEDGRGVVRVEHAGARGGSWREDNKAKERLLQKQRQTDNRKTKELAYKQQVERHRQRQQLIHKQHESVRRQLEQHRQMTLNGKVEEHPSPPRQPPDSNSYNKNAKAAGFNARDRLNAGGAPARNAHLDPNPHDSGGNGVALVMSKNNKDDDNDDGNDDDGDSRRFPAPAMDSRRRQRGAVHDNQDTNENKEDEVPDAPHGAEVRPYDDHHLDGMSDKFRRGLIKKVRGGDDSSNLNNLPNADRNAFPPEQPIREIGGVSINWDWDDFALTFLNYGAAEMKVRRAPHSTTGEPWPLPQYYTKKDKSILVVDPKFEFVLNTNISCDVIDEAIERYGSRIREFPMEDMYDNLQNAEGSHLDSPDSKYGSPLYLQAPVISKFSLKVRKACTVFPSMESDESYDLVVKKSSAYLWANEVWGLLRGLETLSQLIWKGPDDRLYVKETVVSDYPRFPHRGILIDSSRHFIFKHVLFDMMDAMEMNKMNVMHWHIVDDQSFPYESQVFPELSAKGAYHPTFVYSLDDIAEIIDYARLRGIRVLPEFDSPGHTYSWGLSRPELLTQCYSGTSPVKGYLGPIDPVRNSTYRFLRTLFGEILHVFKDEYMHLGGDEVPLGCWQSNPDVTRFAEKLSRRPDHHSNDDPGQGYYGGPFPSIRLVYEYYVNKIMKDIKDMGQKRNGIKFIMWQEVMNNDLKLPNDTLIQVWMGDMADMSRAISMGYNVLYSTCWYLDHVEYGVKWPKYYQCDPVDSSYGYNIDEKKVKGGEACLWSEYIDNENLLQTTWPRASAVAERLWSSKDTRNLDSAGERLSEHRCRMLRRGLSVGQISGPDYCLRRGPGRERGRHGSGCQGNGCSGKNSEGSVETQSDIKFHVRTEAGGSSDCNWIGDNLIIVILILVLTFIILISLSRSSGKLYTLRTCRQRTIVVVFLTVLLVYFMCYTTMWMNVVEFSGSFHKQRPA